MRRLRSRTYKIRGKLSYGRRVLSFVFLTLTAFVLIYTILLPFTSLYDVETYNPIMGIVLAGIPLIAGVAIGTRRNIHVNSDKKHISVNQSIATVIFSRRRIPYRTLEYVTVFRNSQTEYFEGRLFYNENDYVNLFEIKNQDEAIQWTHRICDALSIPTNNLIFDDYWEDKDAPFVAPKDREISVFLSEGKRPLWQSFLAALCFTISIGSLYYFIVVWSRNDFQRFEDLETMIHVVIVSGGMGVGFSLVRDYLFDFKNNHYKKIFRIGPLQYGKWKTFRSMEYISIYRKPLGQIQLLLWYNKSRHFTLGSYGEKKDAYEVAKQLALQFYIDIYDGTSKDGHWIYVETLTEDISTPMFVPRLDE